MGEYSISVSVSRPFTARDAGVSHGQASVMESGDENEMVERFRGHSLSLRNDKGPVWDGRCSAFRSYWYDMYVFLKCCNDGKLVKTVDGEDREDRLAADESVRNAYARRNLLVWRYMIRSIDKQCRTSKAVRLMIIDDFQEDHDGYELIQYLTAYANEQSDTDVWTSCGHASRRCPSRPPSRQHGGA